MKKIICEMCGSSDLMKKDGVYECQSCGTKYSVEEAKKMMVEGTVKVDNSDYVENYLEMAEVAYDAGNFKESEEYCNKIIENNSTIYKAWFMKGKSVGWQSTLAKQRFSESANCFGKAIKYAPEDLKEEIQENGAQELNNLGLALIKLRGSHFIEFPTKETANDFKSDYLTIVNSMVKYILNGGTVSKIYSGEVAKIMYESAVNAWDNKVWPEYVNDHGGYPNEYAMKHFIDYGDNCKEIIKFSIELDDDDYESDIVRYQTLITLEKKLIEACSYEYAGAGYYSKSATLTSEAKRIRNYFISEYQKKISELELKVAENKKKEKKESLEKYFKEHPEEKAELEDVITSSKKEIKKLLKNIDESRAGISGIEKKISEEVKPLADNLSAMGKELYNLSAEKSQLGIFDRKRKKELQEAHDGKQVEYNALKAKFDSAKEIARSKNEKELKKSYKNIAESKDKIDGLLEKITSASIKRYGEVEDLSDYKYTDETPTL